MNEVRTGVVDPETGPAVGTRGAALLLLLLPPPDRRESYDFCFLGSLSFDLPLPVISRSVGGKMAEPAFAAAFPTLFATFAAASLASRSRSPRLMPGDAPPPRC